MGSPAASSSPPPKRLERGWQWVALFPFVCVLGFGAMLVGSFVWSLVAPPYEPTGKQELTNWFWSEFGQKLPPGVEVLAVRTVTVGDGEVRFFKLRTHPAFVNDLLQKRFAENGDERGRAESNIRKPGGNEPTWWTPEKDEVTEFYYAREWLLKRSEGETNDASIGINRAKTLLYLMAESIH